MLFLTSLRRLMNRGPFRQERWRSTVKNRPTYRPRLEVLEDRRLLSSMVVGDFNGDQRLDMAVMNENGLTVLLNQGNGAFLAVPVPGLADVGEGPASLVAGDFNGDGKLDLAVATPAGDRPGGGCIVVLLGQGDGSFQQAFDIHVHGHPSALVAGDFNGDGKLDLAVANDESVTILFGNGDGSFVSGPNLSLPETGDDSSSQSGGDIQEGLATGDDSWSSLSQQSVLES
jgi:hypothetical protein